MQTPVHLRHGFDRDVGDSNFNSRLAPLLLNVLESVSAVYGHTAEDVTLHWRLMRRNAQLAPGRHRVVAK